MKNKSDGLIDLIFSEINGRTIAKRIYHEGNSRVSSNVHLPYENTPYYFLINTGGGFIEGETYEVNMTLLSHSHVIITSQAPTYVYKCDNRIETGQKVSIHLEENSFLEYLTDEVIPYKNAVYSQETMIHMTPTSTLALIDGVTAGWSEDEKDFQYSSVQMKTSIYMDKKLIYNDHSFLTPEKDDIRQLGFFEGHQNYNSLVVISHLCTNDVIEKIKEKLSKLQIEVDFGLSTLEKPGFILRTMSDKGEKNRKVLMHALNIFRSLVFELPELELNKNDHYFK